MDFGFSAKQQALKQSARRFLQRECAIKLVRKLQAEDSCGHSPELWQQMAALGWLKLALPLDCGGLGASLLDLGVIYEESGRALVPTTLYSTITGALAILNGGSEEQKHTLLPRIGSGELVLTLALAEPNAMQDPEALRTQAEPRGDGYVLNGTKMFIQNAHVADYLIVVARTGSGSCQTGVTCFLVDGKSQGLSCRAMRTFGKDRQSEVRLEGVRVPEASVLGTVNEGWPGIVRTLEQATALQCAEMVGGAQVMLDITVGYVKERVQFDRPIGSFQAVQHHVANMAMDLDSARFTSYQALSRLSKGFPATREVSIAKAVTSEAYKRISLMAHQLHGGMGFTLDYDLHLWSNRAKATELSLGTYDYHLEVVAQQMGI